VTLGRTGDVRHSIAHALVACILAVVLMLPGQHRSSANPPALAVPDIEPLGEWHPSNIAENDEEPERLDDGDHEELPAEQDTATGPPDETSDPFEIIMDDETLLSPWYVVLALSWAGVEAIRAGAELQAVQEHRSQADADGDDREECWEGCPCRKLPATAC
jgi:hypothetical protein